MTGFDIDEVQANYIAEIKLRNLNREYILNRIAEIENLRREIAEIEEILADDIKLKGVIAAQLTEVKKKFGQTHAGRRSSSRMTCLPPSRSLPLRITRCGSYSPGKAISKSSLPMCACAGDTRSSTQGRR